MLVAGSCIGAGMLGLPVITASAGYVPTFFTFIICWLFMTVTGLMLLEVNLWFKEDVSIVSMAGETLGKVGKILGWVLFVFLFYSLLVAFIAASGQLIQDFTEEIFNIYTPEWVGSLALLIIFFVLIYLGTKMVDHFNRYLMLALIVTYLVMVVVGLPHVNMQYLSYSDFSKAGIAIPTMIISFGFHNLIPSLTTYLKHDKRALRLAIIIGSLIPLVIYMVFEAIILGLVPVEGGLKEALLNQDMATRALRKTIGSSWIVDLAEYFSFFAIVTTLLTVSLSFVDFLADGLKMKKEGVKKVILCLLTIVPPFIFALIYPKVFLVALSYAGAFGAVLLFGVLPALMLWSGRYYKKLGTSRIIPGGKITLVVVILFSLVIMIMEICK